MLAYIRQSIDLMCFSSDIQEVSMTYTINYQISKADAMTIYSTIGINYYETVVIPCITESVKTVTARYTAEELVGMRSELASAIEVDLSAKLIKYNIELVSTSVENMDFTDVFTEAVEAKQVAAQNKLTSTMDIAPTIANLFDLDVNYAYYTGDDIFSDGGYVIFRGLNWYDGDIYYTPDYDGEMTDDVYTYIYARNTEVSTRINASWDTFRSNYFATLTP